MSEPEAPHADYADALRSGIDRAKRHLLKAGIEVVSGMAAIVEELIRARDQTGEDDQQSAPKRIELE